MLVLLPLTLKCGNESCLRKQGNARMFIYSLLWNLMMYDVSKEENVDFPYKTFSFF